MATTNFEKIELFGWALALIITVTCHGCFFVFLLFSCGVRYFYMRHKKSKLGLLSAEGKSVVITGCDSGFGLALAKRLYKKGVKVYALCLSLSSDGASSLNGLDSNLVKVMEVDVTKDEMVSKCLNVIEAECEHTGLWGLVNNAGFVTFGDAEMITMDQYIQVCNVNLFGMIRMCKAFIPLVRQAKGRIVNVTSVKGRMAIHGADAYTVSKFGAQAFSEVLKQEMRPSDVRVITIEPGQFSGVTGILNEASMTRMSKELDTMWVEASPKVQEFYGKAHFQNKLEKAKRAVLLTHPTMDPVLDAEEDALLGVCPQPSYLVDGSDSYFDKTPIMARLSRFLPETLCIELYEYLYPYTIHK